MTHFTFIPLRAEFSVIMVLCTALGSMLDGSADGNDTGVSRLNS